MPKYINADKIISHLNDEIEACGDPDVYFQPVVYGTYLGLKSSKSFIETAETADVQEVVRCKDCKYFYQDGNIKVCKHWNCHSTTDGAYCSYGERRKEDVKMSTVDVREVRHGRWISNDLGGYKWAYYCSECGWVDGYPFNDRHKYCPHCGAKMDGERGIDTNKR